MKCIVQWGSPRTGAANGRGVRKNSHFAQTSAYLSLTVRAADSHYGRPVGYPIGYTRWLYFQCLSVTLKTHFRVIFVHTVNYLGGRLYGWHSMSPS